MDRIIENVPVQCETCSDWDKVPYFEGDEPEPHVCNKCMNADWEEGLYTPGPDLDDMTEVERIEAFMMGALVRTEGDAQVYINTALQRFRRLLMSDEEE